MVDGLQTLAGKGSAGYQIQLFLPFSGTWASAVVVTITDVNMRDSDVD
jgi:hypothetical protein